VRASPRGVLRGRADDRALRRDGYVVVDLIAPDAATALRRRFLDRHGHDRHDLTDFQPPDFEIALWDTDLGYRREVDAMIDEATTPALCALFTRQRPVGRSFMVKWPAAPGSAGWDGVPDIFHSDSPYVDERDGSRSYGVWVALQDVDERNGCVHVVPHSHRLPRTLRGWGIEAPWLAHEEVLRRHQVPVRLGAGQAFVWDSALVHRSGPNRTDDPRVAVTVLVADPDAPLSIFRRVDTATAEKVRIADDFFVSGRYDELTTMPSTETVPIDEATLSERALAGQLALLAAAGRVAQATTRTRRRP
jgi:hypothetical protein